MLRPQLPAYVMTVIVARRNVEKPLSVAGLRCYFQRMRGVLLTGFLFAGVFSTVAYTRPAYIRSSYFYARDMTHHLLFEREVEFSGFDLLNKDRVAKLLPVKKSNFWWRLNQSAISRELSANPMIQSASVDPCTVFSLRCFRVTISERETGILAVFSDRIWVLGSDGGYVATAARSVEDARVEKLKARFALPLVYGLDRDGASPGMVRSRALYALRSRGRMERKLNASVDRITLLSGGELEVQFREYPFAVVFGSSFDNPAQLDEELRKFAALLREIAGKERAIKRIDMAYDRSAVVTLTPQAEAAQARSLKEKARQVQLAG